MNLKLLIVVIVIAVAVAVGGTYAVLLRHTRTTTTTTSLSQLFSERPGELNSGELSSMLGGNWTMLTNASFVAVVKQSEGKLYVEYINGTSKTLNLTSGLEMVGPTGQANGGYPLWVAGYFYYYKASPNATYVLGIEVFRATNSTQANWTLSAVENYYKVPPSTLDGLTYVELRPYAPLSNITFVYASYRSTYIIVVMSSANASEGSIAQVATASARNLP